MKPHVCPKCDGEREVPEMGSITTKRPCPTCGGTGIVWCGTGDVPPAWIPGPVTNDPNTYIPWNPAPYVYPTWPGLPQVWCTVSSTNG